MAASAQELPTFAATSFWKQQGFEQSARLHLQHHLWKYQFGYTLHPKIEISPEKKVRVADVAAGNGAWLLDLSDELPGSTLDGYDITKSNVPHEAWLPSNVKFHIWDAFTDVPNELVGVYDIVHIRAFYSLIKDNQIEPVMSNLLKLLKPGGYLQWDENDSSTQAALIPSDDVSAEATKTIISTMQILSRAQNKLLPDWLHNLPSLLQDKGCTVIAHETPEPKKELARAWSDNVLSIWVSTIPLIPETPVPLPPGMGLPESLSRTSFSELIARAAQESVNGVSVRFKQVIVVARKDT